MEQNLKRAQAYLSEWEKIPEKKRKDFLKDMIVCNEKLVSSIHDYIRIIRHILKNEDLYNDLRNTPWYNEEKNEELVFDLNKYEENEHDLFLKKNVDNEVFIYMVGCCYKHLL